MANSDRRRKVVSVTPDPELWDRLKAEAAKNYRPITRQLDMALTEHLTRIEQRQETANQAAE